jgi:histidine triad (HIT) family protein
MECTACNLKEGILYEDEQVIVVLPKKGAVLGHMQVCTKKHVETLQDLDDKETQKVFSTAMAAASAVYEYFGAHGTNVLVNEGNLKENNHLCLNIIPRKMEDGLNFAWEPSQLPEEDMNSTFEAIKDKAFYIGKEKAETIKEPTNLDKPPETVKENTGENGEKEVDYQVKQLHRIP